MSNQKTQKKEAKSPRDSLAGAGITVTREELAEKRKQALETLKTELSKPIDVSKPSDALDMLLKKIAKVAWFVRKEAAPNLAAKDRQKCAILMQRWERWVEEASSIVMNVSFAIKKWQGEKILASLTDEGKKIIESYLTEMEKKILHTIMRAKVIQSAEGTVLECIWFVDTHVIALAMFIWSVAWGEKDVDPTIFAFQLPYMFGGGGGFGETTPSSGGRVSETYPERVKKPQGGPYPSQMSSKVEED